MKYARILMAVASEIWAMHPDKLEAMIDLLALQADGIKFDASEIEARIGGRSEEGGSARQGSIGILPVRGVIANRMNMMSAISGGTSNEALSAAFRQLVDDDGVKAIVLDIDSPGGNVQGTEELARLISSARGSKPIIAQVDATAASAAYWIASSADEIVITPTGWVGSIGAMTAHQDISAALEKAGIKRTLISSSEFKNEASSHLPLSDTARAHLEEQVRYIDGMFVDRIAANRNIPSDRIRADFGRGRMVIGEHAVSRGMADRVGTMVETLQRLGASTTVPRGSTPRRNRARAAL
ncbi:S49 family peptidase [Aureimonas mangrovi]|uniref:S49 family peptidase n=1 Tax=Aureimonas mangrovi TaxID=2758041 RepID=UPI00163DC8FE|nr:S49 family peptidase [Aureimonas mangrovi]